MGCKQRSVVWDHDDRLNPFADPFASLLKHSLQSPTRPFQPTPHPISNRPTSGAYHKLFFTAKRPRLA
jgi:hypothetical protein